MLGEMVYGAQQIIKRETHVVGALGRSYPTGHHLETLNGGSSGTPAPVAKGNGVMEEQ